MFFKTLSIVLVILTSSFFAPARGASAEVMSYSITTNIPVVRGEPFDIVVECNISDQLIGFEIYRDGGMVYGEYPAVCNYDGWYIFETTFTRTSLYEVRVTVPEVDLGDVLNFPGVTVASLTIDLRQRQKAFIPMVIH